VGTTPTSEIRFYARMPWCLAALVERNSFIRALYVAKNSRAAAAVMRMSSSECAAETKPASNCEGAM